MTNEEKKKALATLPNCPECDHVAQVSVIPEQYGDPYFGGNRILIECLKPCGLKTNIHIDKDDGFKDMLEEWKEFKKE